MNRKTKPKRPSEPIEPEVGMRFRFKRDAPLIHQVLGEAAIITEVLKPTGSYGLIKIKMDNPHLSEINQIGVDNFKVNTEILSGPERMVEDSRDYLAAVTGG